MTRVFHAGTTARGEGLRAAFVGAMRGPMAVGAKQSFRDRIGTQAARFVVVAACESREAFSSERHSTTTRLAHHGCAACLKVVRDDVHEKQNQRSAA